jgi:hypothetical protein
VFNTPEVVKVYVGSFNTARVRGESARNRARERRACDVLCSAVLVLTCMWRCALPPVCLPQVPPNTERNPMGALLFEKEQAVRAVHAAAAG